MRVWLHVASAAELGFTRTSISTPSAARLLEFVNKPEVVTGVINVSVASGLSSTIARRLHDAIRKHQCELTITDARGTVASVRNLFELVILGVKTGEPVTLRATGSDAAIAYALAVELLDPKSPNPSTAST